MKNLKKLLVIMFTAMLCLTGFAMAESADAVDALEINAFIEDGEFIIQVPVEPGDEGWDAYDMAQDPSVVELAIADTIEDTFVARYAPVGDGDMTVGVRHFTGIACDQVMTWDLHVEDGAIREVTGGSHTASSEDEWYDAYILGEWLEQDTQVCRMNIAKNIERGWDVEIIFPVSHGAYIFNATVQFDCELDSFVYENGAYWDIPVDFEDGMDLGEARTTDTCGNLSIEGDEAHLVLSWYDDERPEDLVRFER